MGSTDKKALTLNLAIWEQMKTKHFGELTGIRYYL
jgi:hypothetical protein